MLLAQGHRAAAEEPHLCRRHHWPPHGAAGNRAQALCTAAGIHGHGPHAMYAPAHFSFAAALARAGANLHVLTLLFRPPPGMAVTVLPPTSVMHFSVTTFVGRRRSPYALALNACPRFAFLPQRPRRLTRFLLFRATTPPFPSTRRPRASMTACTATNASTPCSSTPHRWGRMPTA